jgi:hypothetical protein
MCKQVLELCQVQQPVRENYFGPEVVASNLTGPTIFAGSIESLHRPYARMKKRIPTTTDPNATSVSRRPVPPRPTKIPSQEIDRSDHKRKDRSADVEPLERLASIIGGELSPFIDKILGAMSSTQRPARLRPRTHDQLLRQSRG